MRSFFCIVVIFILSGCGIFHAPDKHPSSQPGQYLIKEINARQLSTSKQLISLFKETHAFPNKTNEALAEYPLIAANLLLSVSNSHSPQNAMVDYITEQNEQQEDTLYVALSLYPIDGRRLAEKLAKNQRVRKSIITTASLRAGFDPALLFPATAAGQNIRITALFNSASITLFDQDESTQVDVLFRATNDEQWQPGLALQWEPINGARSGSIVHLTSDTEYTVKLTLSNIDGIFDEQTHTFTTRSNSPPIDPDKIYYLSDIYTGGTLDLEALDIHGTKDGWAKIIGDSDTPIVGPESGAQALYIGDNAYIYFENITVRGGSWSAIRSKYAHHLWFNGCDVSQWGRQPNFVKDGLTYEKESDSKPINYDAAFSLERTGVVVVENCTVHSPNSKANSWQYGHPLGPTAFMVSANHKNEAYQGQIVIRHNRFYGTDDHRFNDVIEGLSNGSVSGGFVRDSAIHDNYLAYANDDIIELDGGQSNVLFYNNEIEQGYCGISAIPNMLGPSYIFNNYIHNLGDERQSSWAAIKLGGLMTAPAGLVNIFDNLIKTSSNGITASSFQDDYTFWVNAQNNILLHDVAWTNMGQGIRDREYYAGSRFINNYIFNSATNDARYDAVITQDFYDPNLVNAEYANELAQQDNSVTISIPDEFLIPNFSQQTNGLNKSNAQSTTINSAFALEVINFENQPITSFSNQDSSGEYTIENEGRNLIISGNTWKQIPFIYEIQADTVAEFQVSSQGESEILGIAFETDNKESSNRSFYLAGTQNNFGISDAAVKEGDTSQSGSVKYSIQVGQYLSGAVNRIVFILDQDQDPSSNIWASFGDVNVFNENDYAEVHKDEESNTSSVIRIGLTEK